MGQEDGAISSVSKTTRKQSSHGADVGETESVSNELRIGGVFFFYCGKGIFTVALARRGRCGVEKARHTFAGKNCGGVISWLWRTSL